VTPTAVNRAQARSAIELLVDELAQAGSDLDRHGFYSRLAEVACRIGELERAVIFRFDEVTRSVEAAGTYGVKLEQFAGVSVNLETAPDAARALSEDRVIEARPAEGHPPVPGLNQLVPGLGELVGDRPLVYVPMAAAGRWPGVIVAQPWAGAPPVDEQRRELLWTLGKTLALASMARIATAQGERAKELEARIDLARDVHDGVIQRLFGVSMALSSQGDLPAADRARCASEVQIALKDLRSALQRPLRGAVNPSPTRLADQLARLSSRAEAPRVWVDGGIPDVPPGLEPLFQSVLAEAIRNLHKHANAPAAVVRLRRRDGSLVLEVENDGVSHFSRPGPPGLGLRLGALEALQAGGLLEFGERSPGRWQVRLTVPEEAA
jgi:signal transduction histidine kinase